MALFRKSFFTGLFAAVFSSVGAIAYAGFYNKVVFDYSKLLGYPSIIAACAFTSIFACVMYWAAVTILKSWGDFVFNFLFVLITVISIKYPLEAAIPGDEFGYFMVYAIPLHYFPVLSWMVFKSLFFRRFSVTAQKPEASLADAE